MKTIYTTLPIYNKIDKQCFERGRHAGMDTPSPIVCPRHQLPSFQWIDGADGASYITKIEMFDKNGDANLITDWTNAVPNSHYSTFVTSGSSITSAKNLAGFGTSSASTNHISVLYGTQYTIIIGLTSTAGPMPRVVCTTVSGGVLYPATTITLVAGVNTLTYKATQDGVVEFGIYADANAEFSATFNLTGYDVTDRYWRDSGTVIAPYQSVTYDTFTAVNPNITSAIKTTAGDVDFAYSTAFSVASGDIIRLSFVLTLNSGTAPVCVLVDSGGLDKSNIVQLVNGLNNVILVSTVTDVNCVLRFRNGAGEVTNYSTQWSFGVFLTNYPVINAHDYFIYEGGAHGYFMPTGEYYLKLTMDNGYVYYSDWFKVDCVYENLLVDLVNSTYDTFSLSGNEILQAINLAGAAWSGSDVFTVRKGEVITVIFWLGLTSGQAPWVYLTNSGWTDDVSTVAAGGVNILTLTPDWTGDAYFRFYNSAASNFATSEILVIRDYSEKYLTIDFHNDCDLGDILYHHGFTQTIWFESETMETSFPQEEEGIKNGDGRFIRTFARQDKKYLARTNVVPDYMVDVFNRLKLHDTVQMTDLVGDVNTMYNLEVEHEWLFEDKYYAKLDLTFDYDEAVVIGGCCNNIT